MSGTPGGGARARAWLLAHTDFDEVVAVGVDRDSRPPYEHNYGRTLFACVRRSASGLVAAPAARR